MSNLTLTIDDDLLLAARVKALQQGTSVNEICRRAIAAFAGKDEADAIALAHARAQAFLDHARSVKLGPGDGRSRLSREQLYDEILAERSPSFSAKRTAK